MIGKKIEEKITNHRRDCISPGSATPGLCKASRCLALLYVLFNFRECPVKAKFFCV
jgi:hypothetical protein